MKFSPKNKPAITCKSPPEPCKPGVIEEEVRSTFGLAQNAFGIEKTIYRLGFKIVLRGRRRNRLKQNGLWQMNSGKATPERNWGTPVNLKKLFGYKYRIEKDPAYDAERAGPVSTDLERQRKKWDLQWLFTIPCRAGGEGAHLFSHGYLDSPRAIGFYGRSSGGQTGQALRKPGFCDWQVDTVAEYIVTFPLERFAEVARMVKPRSRRKLSPEHKAKLLQAGQTSRFKTGESQHQTQQKGRL